MRYDKLVRDRIIDIIEVKGRRATWHVATDEEYRLKLREKLREEVSEFFENPSREEMADVFEVITAVLKERDWALEDIVALQKKKREERGGFERRLILEES